ncbi:hypothetical protein MLD38_018375 [Melastoma candidum]|uniref:Uncharacterized protein n=1 Tax=Melastoma candidum TaxID=119954 RepID=A0ACB9QT33_9MYRT|nr:hypothetical protein MLD38_018375 [Melastoma candidum]
MTGSTSQLLTWDFAPFKKTVTMSSYLDCWRSTCPSRRFFSATKYPDCTQTWSWLSSRFDVLHPEAPEVLVRIHTRAYILQLIGAMIFLDKPDNLMHLMWLPLLEDFERAGTYSWGSACLAWLYRQLCRASQKNASQVAGCLVLLQIWA